jgi:hypothetical protein
MEWKYENIDHSKLNDRIVEQAYHGTLPSVLNEESVQRMIADKIERAKQERNCLVKLGYFTEN